LNIERCGETFWNKERSLPRRTEQTFPTSMPLDLSTIPLIDNHCHSLLRAQPQSEEEFRACFTESYFSEIVHQHVPQTVFYQWALMELAALYDCAPRAEAILGKCGALELAARTRRINQLANIEAWLVDFGYATEQTFAPAELGAITGVSVESILRLEPLIENLLLKSQAFDALHESYVAALQDLRAQGFVSLKSILAYRGGLRLSEATRADAREAFAPLKERASRDGTVRVDSKPLLDYLIPLAVEIAAGQEFPIQFHTGFGDPDQDLETSNPVLLRPLFGEKYRGAKIILLHAGYPYTRELGYLASVYPNVYADFGLAIPFVTAEARSILRELLGLAPASKILYSSDASLIPELHYLGARLARRALEEVLEEFVGAGLITTSAAEEMGELVLRGNAGRVYDIGKS
jgi:hypothetical protein